MKKVWAICCGLFLLSSAVQAKRSEEEKQLRLGYEKAVAYMQDDSFYQKYRSHSFQSPDQAKEIIQRATDRQAQIASYIEKEVTQYCNQRFFVNHCIDQVREQSFERRRENNRIIEAANEYMRLERLKNMKSRQKEVREKSEPISLKPRRVRPPSEPVSLQGRRVRRPSAPMGWRPKRVKRGMSEQRRRALEQANEQAYAQKQLEAEQRKAQAKEYARKRRLERQEHRARWQKTFEERRQAQRRIETQKTKPSTLQEYFQ